ncbi:MAG: response regulator [Candidatus Bathyarchaeota archaeon]
MEQKNILIIYDDNFILNVFSRILQKEGFSVDVAETGQEAFEELETKKYDLALIDVKLPDIDGKDLVFKLKRYPDMKKIVITGFPSIEDATEIMDHGATAYLVKPVKTEELIKLIKEKLE